ncbi:putative transposase [Legionella israelensis]|uniref:Putative transposase n=1 Tax=Legionella israelensis TaxID=454 RepID=A0A0W0VIU5_9GAMM
MVCACVPQGAGWSAGLVHISISYNRTVRYDWLNQYLFESIEQVQEQATKWLWSYNNERPNSAIGGIPPKRKLALAA